MDALFFHPKLVHLPIALSVLMPGIAGGVLLAWWREWLPARAWIVAVVLQATLVASGLAALQSGEAEEERVEPIVAERFIEAHEAAAERFVWASGLVLVGMLPGLVSALGSVRLAAAALATVGSLVVLGLGYRTGEAGGALVYQHGAASAYLEGSLSLRAESTVTPAPLEDDD